jgi:hypothetical protein
MVEGMVAAMPRSNSEGSVGDAEAKEDTAILRREVREKCMEGRCDEVDIN